MESNDKHINLIDKIIRQEANAAEKNAFDQLMKEDASFKKQYHFQKDLEAVSKSQEQHFLKKQLQNLEAKQAIEIPTEAKKRSIVFYLTRMAAAIALLAAAWFVFNTKAPSSEQLFADNFTAHPNELTKVERGTTQSGATASVSILDKAFNAYQKGDYKIALQNFEEYYSASKDENVLFYKAISLIQLDQSKEASTILEKLASSNIKIEASVVQWYLGLSYLKNNKLPAAKQAFQKVLDAPGQFRKTSAKNILEEI